MRTVLMAVMALGFPFHLGGQVLAVDIREVSFDTLGVLSFGQAGASPNFNFSAFPIDAGWGVTSATFPGEIAVFGKDLAWKRMVGGRGGGPGEFQGMLRGVEVGDGMVALDPKANRATWVDSAFRYVGSRPLPGRVFSAQPDGEGGVLAGGQFMVGGSTYTVLGLGTGVDGQLRFGAPSSSPRPQEDFPVLLPPNAGEVWAVKHSGGRVEILDAATLEVKEQRRIPLEGYDVPLPQRFSVQKDPPTPQIVSGSAAENGIGVIFAAVADRLWAPGGLHPEDFYDTEAILVDLPNRTIIGRVRFPGICTAIEGLLAGCLTDLGDVRVLRIRLE